MCQDAYSLFPLCDILRKKLFEPFPNVRPGIGIKEMNAMSDRGSGFGTFLMGGLIGAAIGLLYAPRSGQETRRILAGEGQEMVDRAVTSIREAQDSALMAIRDAQTRLEALNVEAKDRISRLQEIAGATLSEQKESLIKGYSEAKKVVKETVEETPVNTPTTTTTPRS
jgi:gas vesicle protein